MTNTNMTNIKWVLHTGITKPVEYTTFPVAFRAMWNFIQNEAKANRKANLGIITIEGNNKVYNYAKAVELANSFGLVTSEGEINSREFKKKRK